MTGQQATVPLVAQHAQEPTKFFTGTGILESAQGVVDGYNDGEYAALAGNALAFGMSAVASTLGTIMDPLQAVFSAGVGWLFEHVSYLKEPLDWLAGDPGAIQNNAQTWGNIRVRIDEAVQHYGEALQTNAELWQSRAATAYQAEARDHIETLQGLSRLATAGEKGCTVVAAMVAVVRSTIRDIIADVVGAAISKALQALTVVLAPKALVEIAVLIGKVSTKILSLLDRLVKAVRRLAGLTERGADLLKRIQQALDGAATLKSSRIAGGLLADGAGAGSGLASAWKAVGGGQQLVYGTTGRVVRDGVKPGLLGNFAQEAGGAVDKLRTQAQKAEDEVHRQEQQRQAAAAAAANQG